MGEEPSSCHNQLVLMLHSLPSSLNLPRSPFAPMHHSPGSLQIKAKEGEMQMCPLWHLHTQLWGPGAQFGREMPWCKARKKPPALPTGRSQLHSYRAASSQGGPGALPASLTAWQPHNSPMAGQGTACPPRGTQLLCPSPTSGARTVWAGHLLLSPHVLQILLTTSTLQKQEAAYSTLKLKNM